MTAFPGCTSTWSATVGGTTSWSRRRRELGVQDAVTFHGYLPGPERDRVVAASWVLLMPSVKEGWGIAIMEAAALGVPAIGYRNAGGVAEAIVDHTTGHLVDDLTDLVKSCETVLLDRAFRDALGAAACARARTFSWTYTAETFAAALDDAVRADRGENSARARGAVGQRLP